MNSGKIASCRCPLIQLYCYITEGCNLRCRHCWNAPKYKNPENLGVFLDLALFREILKQAKPLGLTGVKLTGGEPLLHPQVGEMLEVIRAADLRLGIETNGVLITPSLAKAMARGNSPTISVSLDGVNAETHEWVRRVPGSFNHALEGIRHLVGAGLMPQIIFTIMRCNVEQIPAIVRLAEKLEVGSLKFNIVQPLARGEQLSQTGECLDVKELLTLGRWVETKLSQTTKLPIFFSHPLAFRPLSRMFDAAEGDCAICGIRGILGVLADGSYALCGIGTNVPGLVFGHALRDRLADVWHQHPVLQELREGLPDRLEGICRQCLLRNICLGFCLAQNYYQANSLWAPFWYCQAAESLGLFPASRKRPAPAAKGEVRL
jgi:SynChlorMet cassette radical SAM/SPASM protein ScmF